MRTDWLTCILAVFVPAFAFVVSRQRIRTLISMQEEVYYYSQKTKLETRNTKHETQNYQTIKPFKLFKPSNLHLSF